MVHGQSFAQFMYRNILKDHGIRNFFIYISDILQFGTKEELESDPERLTTAFQNLQIPINERVGPNPEQGGDLSWLSVGSIESGHAHDRRNFTVY